MASQSNNQDLTAVGASIDIVGIAIGNRGRSCPTHDICGSEVKEGTMVRLRHQRIIVSEGEEEDVIAVYLETADGDGCRVGFTPRHLVAHRHLYDAALAQVTDVYSKYDDSLIKRRKYHHNHGFAVAVLVKDVVKKKKLPPPNRSPNKSPSKKKSKFPT
jgi:hypothetical protein